jgi:uncharacterized protein
MSARLACLLLLMAAGPVWGSDLPEYPFIFVTGHSSKEIQPDLATVSFAIKARSPDASSAAEAVDKRTKEVLALLEAGKVPAGDIDAHAISKETMFDEGAGDGAGAAKPARRLYYVLTRSFAVRLHNIASWPQIGTRLMQMENIEDIGAQFDRSDRRALETELFSAAAHDAQQRAESLASGFGQRLGPVQAISQEPFDGLSSRFLRSGFYGDRMFKRSEVPSASELLVPATIPIEKSVNVIYRLESSKP